MNIDKYVIPKNKLLSFSKEKRNFFILLGHMQNEINILLKCILFKLDFDTTNEPQHMGDMSYSLMFLRLMASKLFAAWEILTKKGKNKKIPEWLEPILPPEIKDMWKKFIDYFNNPKNNLKVIRNKFGFHYDKEIIDYGFQNLTIREERDLKLFLTEKVGNSLNTLSDVIIFASIRKKQLPQKGKILMIL
jgi:hypothetical protein